MSSPVGQDASLERLKDQGLERLSRVIASLGARPDHLNCAGAILAGLTALFYASGNPSLVRLALLAYLASLACDALDGSLARYLGVADVEGAAKDHIADRVSDSLIAVGVMWAGLSNSMMCLVLAGVLLTTSFVPSMAKQLALRAEVPPARLPKLALGSRPVRALLIACALSLPMLGEWTDTEFIQCLLFTVAGLLGNITGLMRLRAAFMESGGARPFFAALRQPRRNGVSSQAGEISDRHKKVAILVSIVIPLIAGLAWLATKASESVIVK